VNPILSTLINRLLGPVLDRVLPDPQKRMEAQLELARMAQAGDFKEIEAELERERIGIERTRADNEDRVSARQREREVKDRTPSILSAIVVGGFFATLGVVIFASVPNEVQALVNVLLGSLSAGLTQVLQYYFGSSSGSARKEATLQALAAQPQQQVQIAPARDVTVESPSSSIIGPIE